MAQWGRGWVFAVLMAAILTSCQTTPVLQDRDLLGLLPQDADVLLELSVAENDALIEHLTPLLGLDERFVASAQRRTSRVALGFEYSQVSEGGMPSLHAVAEGRWPRSFIGSALGDGWESEGSYRWQGPEGFELAAPSSKELYFSQGRLAEMVLRREMLVFSPLEEVLKQEAQDADLILWIRDLTALGSRLPPPLDASLLMPVRDLFIRLKQSNQELYDVSVLLRAEEEKYTRGLALAMRLGLAARLATSPFEMERELFSRLTVESDELSVRVLMPGLSLDMISSLLSLEEVE